MEGEGWTARKRRAFRDAERRVELGLDPFDSALDEGSLEWLYLPEDIRGRVVTFLNIEDLGHLDEALMWRDPVVQREYERRYKLAYPLWMRWKTIGGVIEGTVPATDDDDETVIRRPWKYRVRMLPASFVRVTWLDLRHQKLDAVEPGIGQLEHLRELFLDNNNLCDLPSTLADCKFLERLHIRNNDFSRVPSVLASFCDRLTLLGLDHNPNIKELPAFFGKMKALDILDICDLGLSEIPDFVMNLFDRTKGSLRILRAIDNPLRESEQEIRARWTPIIIAPVEYCIFEI